MKRKLSHQRVFALKDFTIKIERGKFFISPTGCNRWSGTYKSLHRATTTIARKLARAFTERDTRRQQFVKRAHG